MTVTQDLIAAKALVDMPTKLVRGLNPKRGERHFMQEVARGDVSVYARMTQLLSDAMPDQGETLSDHLKNARHADIMALFDRAIAPSSLGVK